MSRMKPFGRITFAAGNAVLNWGLIDNTLEHAEARGGLLPRVKGGGRLTMNR